MRQQPLTGYVLHQKPYQDHRSLTYFFSKEYGLVHGVGKKNLPLFVPITLFATGKSSLKTFSQPQILHAQSPYPAYILYSGFYLNEILIKLLNVEETYPKIWLNYQHCLNAFLNLKDEILENRMIKLKFYLRKFEILLFEELGYGLNFLQDGNGQFIDFTKEYVYQWQTGFVIKDVIITQQQRSQMSLTGQQLQQWYQWLQDERQFLQMLTSPICSSIQTLLQVMGCICKQIMSMLLDHQPLTSREIYKQMLYFSKQI